MARRKEAIRLFWEEVASGLSLREARISDSRRDTKLTGEIRGYSVDLGAHVATDQHDQPYSWAAIDVEGLPAGLEVSDWGIILDRILEPTSGTRVQVECEAGKSKGVIARPATVPIEGLRLEQILDLDAYLTPERRRVICSLESSIRPLPGRHQVIATLPGEPYPGRRDLSRALEGDPESMSRFWQSRDKLIDLTRTALNDAATAATELVLSDDS